MSDGDRPRLPKKVYKEELARLQVELSRLQRWIINQGLREVPLRSLPLGRLVERHDAANPRV